MKYCDQCGAKLRNEAKFCDQCGNKIETVNEQRSCKGLIDNDVHLDDLIENNTFIETTKYGQGIKYESFWNDVPCSRFGNIDQKQVREYKGKIYFMVSEECLTGEKDNYDKSVIIGEVDKNNLSVFKSLSESNVYTDRKSGCRVWEMLMHNSFSVFDNKIYYAKAQDILAQEGEGEIRRIIVISYDLTNGKEFIVGKVKVDDSDVRVQYILQNSKKEIICIMSVDNAVEHYNCAYNFKTGAKKKINMSNILGYNEKFFYYNDKVDNEVILKIMNLETLQIANLSEKLTNIGKLEAEEVEAQFYMVDAARDVILFSKEEYYVDDPKVVIYAVDLSNNVWEEASVNFNISYRGRNECLVYNGEYWIGTVHPDSVDIGQYSGLECYDKKGNIISTYYKRKDENYLFDGQGVVFALPHVFCSMWGGKDAVTKQEVWTKDAQRRPWLFNFNLFYLEGDDDVDSNVVIREGETSFYY